MKQIMLSVNQIRRWTSPHPWMVNGYSNTLDIYNLYESDRMVQAAAGGWTLNSSDYLRIRWDAPVDKEGLYYIDLNQERVYRSVWTPKLGETVTESFFAQGDLWAINYRLLKVFEPDSE